MNIDPNTNLPQLPEDHFWSISEHEIAVMKHVPAGEWSEWASRLGGSILRSTDHDSRENEVTFGRFIKRKKTVKQWRWRYSADEKRVFAKRYGVSDSIWERGLEIPTLCIEQNPVTTDNILERTTEVYNEWQAKIAREKLYGNYPPKRLEATDED